MEHERDAVGFAVEVYTYTCVGFRALGPTCWLLARSEGIKKILETDLLLGSV